jgi:hypothetical protein
MIKAPGNHKKSLRNLKPSMKNATRYFSLNLYHCKILSRCIRLFLLQHGIIFVKISDEVKVRELGIQIPSLVYFENRVPHLYEGDLADEENVKRWLSKLFSTLDLFKKIRTCFQVLAWLLHQLNEDEIEEVTDEMLDSLIANNLYVAALFCKWCVHVVSYPAMYKT